MDCYYEALRNPCMEKNQLRILYDNRYTRLWSGQSVATKTLLSQADKSVYHFTDSLTDNPEQCRSFNCTRCRRNFYVVKHKSRLPACKIFAPNKFELLNEV